MSLPRFELYQPASIEEACALLNQRSAEGAALLAGGTDLLVNIRCKVIPEHLPRCRGCDPATGEAIGDTESNLGSAIAGETYEFTEMYPGFAKAAREEGFDEIAEWFETLARAEKSHAGRFTKALDDLS